MIMKSVLLCVFSGTGNTGIVTEMLRDHLVRRGCSVDIVLIDDVLKGKRTVEPGRYDLVGIGCQVIGFAAPSLVTRFIRGLPRGQGKKAFVFRTTGGVAPINYNASKPMIRALRRRGYEVFHERLFSISSNWIFRFDDEVILKLHESARKKTGLMADALIRGEKRLLKTGIRQRILMETVAAVCPLFFRLVGKDFRVDDSCTHCGLCVRNCPAGNIVERNSRISFGLSCNSCLRCLYACPSHSIRLRRFAFFAVEGGYDIRKILAAASTSPREKTRPEPEFLERYLSDDSL